MTHPRGIHPGEFRAPEIRRIGQVDDAYGAVVTVTDARVPGQFWVLIEDRTIDQGAGVCLNRKQLQEFRRLIDRVLKNETE